MAGPILVGKLGWEDVTSLRIWARPKRVLAEAAWRRVETSAIERAAAFATGATT